MADLLGADALRALRFIQVMNTHRVHVDKGAVTAFLDAPTSTIGIDPYWEEVRIETIDYLLTAQLVDQLAGGGIALNAVGDALLSASTSVAEGGPTVEVVGRLEDPFVYAELLNRIDDLGDVLIIDPYLRPSNLSDLLRISTVTRILTKEVGVKGLSRERRTEKLRLALSARPTTNLRFASDPTDLHDRLVVPDRRGKALMLGTSLGGTQLTVATHLGVSSTDVLRAHYERIWDEAVSVEATAREED